MRHDLDGAKGLCVEGSGWRVRPSNRVLVLSAELHLMSSASKQVSHECSPAHETTGYGLIYETTGYELVYTTTD